MRAAAPSPDPIEETLEELYQEPDGSLPDMKHFERGRTRTWATVFGTALVFLVAASGAAWFGYFLFMPAHKFSEQQITLAMVAPQPVTIGTPQEYRITIRNTSELGLASSDVYVKMPQPFVVTMAEPTPTTGKNERWTLGAIDAGSEKTIKITGVLGLTQQATAAPSAAAPLAARAMLSYRPSNFNADFQKVTDQTLGEPAGALTLRMDATDKDKQTRAVNATIKNETAETITDATAVITVGSGFTITTSSPAGRVNGADVIIPLPALEPRSELRISLIGKKGPAGPSTQKFVVTRLVGQTDLLIGTTEQKRTEPKIHTVSASSTTPLVISARIAESDVAGVSARPDQPVDLSITFTNNTAALLKNVSLRLEIDAPSLQNKSILDYTRLGTVGNPDIIGKQLSPARRLGTITWKSGPSIPELKELASGAMATVTARLYVRDQQTIEEALNSIDSKGSVQVTGKMIADGTTLTSEPLIFVVENK